MTKKDRKTLFHIANKTHRNHVLMLCYCIKDNIEIVMGRDSSACEGFDEAVQFLFGDGIVEFIEKYELPFDAVKMKKLIFSYLVDFHHNRKRTKFMEEGAESIFEMCLLQNFDLDYNGDEEVINA